VCLFRLLIGAAAAAWACSLFAVEWNTTTGGNLDDAANWDATPKGTDYLYVKTGQSAPFTLSTPNANFFGGAMLRYSASFTVTNDFGAGFALTNLGAAADSAFHIENNAKVVHKSGTIIAFKGKTHDGTYLTGKAKLILDGPDAVFEQRTGAFNLRSNSASGKDEEWVIVTNGASLTVKNSTLRIGANNKASEGHVVVTGSGSTLTANATYIGYDACNAGVTSVVEVANGGHFKSTTLEVGSTRTGDRLLVTGAGTLCEAPDTFYARRAADVRVSDQATLTAKDLIVGASVTDRTRLTVTSDAVVYATRTVGLDNASMVVDGARLCVTNNSKLGCSAKSGTGIAGIRTFLHPDAA